MPSRQLPPNLMVLISERVVLGVIAFNMLVLFLRGFPAFRGTEWDQWLFVLDYACLLFFGLEVILKVYYLGWEKYWSSNMNRFDFLIVAASAPALLAPLIGSAEDLALVLLLRGGRLLRFLRLLRFIPNAEHTWAGVWRALKASVGLILALTLYNLVLGLVASHLFHQFSPEHFGDPMISIYTIFKVFTVEGWFEVPDLIAARSSPAVAYMVRGFFVFTVVTGGLLGLSITNAVLVDEMVMDNNDALEAELKQVHIELAALRCAHEEGVKAILARLEAADEEDHAGS